MAQAASAYRYDYYASTAPQRIGTPDVRATRTGGDASQDARPSLLATVGKLAAVVLVVVAVLSFARIALTNAAVTTMIESDTISAQIAEARSSGVGLEMEQSVLTSTSAINSAVKRLNMGATYGAETIALEKDVVALDSNGSLSLSGSVKNVVGAQG